MTFWIRVATLAHYYEIVKSLYRQEFETHWDRDNDELQILVKHADIDWFKSFSSLWGRYIDVPESIRKEG